MDGKQRLRCKWCDMSFAGWNATKAIAHVTKQLKMDIKPCKVKIDSVHMKLYQNMMANLKKKRARMSNKNSKYLRVITSHNNEAALALDSQRTKRSKSSSIDNDDTVIGKQ